MPFDDKHDELTPAKALLEYRDALLKRHTGKGAEDPLDPDCSECAKILAVENLARVVESDRKSVISLTGMLAEERRKVEALSARSADSRTLSVPAELLAAEKVRAPVLQFAVAMERELKANDHKGGWKDCGLKYLFRRIREEVDELQRAAYTPKSSGADTICSEAADVGNFAMMIADVCAALPAAPAPSVLPSVADMEHARRMWHRQLGLDGISPCPTERECRAFDAGFQAVRSATRDSIDAARYRFLRDGEPGSVFVTSKEVRGQWVGDSDVDLDRYIDEALAGSRQRGEHG